MSITSSFSKLQELLPQLFQANTIEGDRYLSFSLNEELMILKIQTIFFTIIK